ERRAWRGEQKDGGLPGASAVTAELGPNTRGVVRAEQIPETGLDRRLVEVSDARRPRRERRWRNAAIQILQHSFAPGVVHHRIELRTVEPADRVVPDLTDDERVRFGRLDSVPERSPEPVIDLVRDVQPPTVDVGLADPPLADPAEVVAQRLVGPQMRIDLLVVGGVVLVVRRRGEDGREVEAPDPEIVRPRQALADAGEIAAEERTRRRLLAPGPRAWRIRRRIAIREAI